MTEERSHQTPIDRTVLDGLHRLHREGRPDIAKTVIMLFLEGTPPVVADLEQAAAPEGCGLALPCQSYPVVVWRCGWRGSCCRLGARIWKPSLERGRCRQMPRRGLGRSDSSTQRRKALLEGGAPVDLSEAPPSGPFMAVREVARLG